MGSFEANYDDEFLASLKQEQRTQLQALHQKLDDKFDEIASFLAKELGVERSEALEEAEFAIERWEEEAEMSFDPPVEVTTPLQRLLRARNLIEGDILDLRDGALGL